MAGTTVHVTLVWSQDLQSNIGKKSVSYLLICLPLQNHKGQSVVSVCSMHRILKIQHGPCTST